MIEKMKIKPCSGLNEDCLNWQPYINGICACIQQTFANNENVCIGIVGEWGHGKTSAINMCLEQLKGKYKKQSFNILGCFIFVVICLSVLALLLYNISLLKKCFDFVDKDLVHLNVVLLLLLIICIFYKKYKYILKKTKEKFIRLWQYFTVKNQLVEIHFSPWNCTSKEQLLEEYLKLLSNQLNFVIPNIAPKLLQYANIVTGIDLCCYFGNFFPKKDLSTLKKEIEEILYQTDKKIIVVIDDIDRIQGEEIFNLLKLIGIIANFPNIVNIVAYDKKYICDNLNTYFNSNNAEKYIQKIIPFEFPLPQISNENMQNLFNIEFMEIIKDKDYNETGLKNKYSNTIGGYLKNIRDLKQLLTAFEFHYNIFKKQGININITDLLFITAIKTFNYKLWIDIYNCGKDYFSSNNIFKDLDGNEKEYFDNHLKYNELDSFEKNIICSMIPRISEVNEYKTQSILDSDIYTIKRFWHDSNTFNMYFEYNPSKTNIDLIFKYLFNADFNVKNFENMIKTDVDWSDLNDIVFAPQYIKRLEENIQSILNFLEFILTNKEAYNQFNFIYFQHGNEYILQFITPQKFNELIEKILAKGHENIDAIVDLVNVYYLYDKSSSYRYYTRTLNQEDLKYLNELLVKMNEILRLKNINELSYFSICYICYNFGKFSSASKEIIQQKIYNDVKKLDNEELLNYLEHFIYNPNNQMATFEVLKSNDIFGKDTKEVLKQKLLLLQQNSKIMNKNEYKHPFVENPATLGEIKDSHIVDFILKTYLN